MPISVLYIHAAGAFGGASRSLLELVRAFPAGSVQSHLITPRGNVASFFAGEGCQVLTTRGISQFDNTRFGYYRKWRWLVLLREFLLLFGTVYTLFKAGRTWKDIDLVHVNEVTALLPVILAKYLFGKPVVVHFRSVQAANRAPLRTRLQTYILKRFADGFIAIDETVRKSAPRELPIEVVHNGFAVDNYIKGEGGCDQEIEQLAQQKGAMLRVAMIGNLLKFKGVSEFVEAAKICKERGCPVRFVFVGGESRQLKGLKRAVLKRLGFAHDVLEEIKQFIAENNLDDVVRFVGFTSEIQKVYRNIDVLCFPSYLNAAGRPVFEAAFLKVPSIVAIKDPLPDTIIDGETGICIEEKNARALADAICYLYENPEERKRLGENAYSLAMKNFDIHKNARRILEMYQGLVNSEQ
jgi:glycosyltransferase involved in cell wall biosynthesis